MISTTPNLSGLSGKPLSFVSESPLLRCSWVSFPLRYLHLHPGCYSLLSTRHQKSRLVLLFPFLSNINSCLMYACLIYICKANPLHFTWELVLCKMSMRVCPFASVQFSSVAQSCPTICDPTNRSTPGLPVYHQFLEFPQNNKGIIIMIKQFCFWVYIQKNWKCLEEIIYILMSRTALQ